MPLGKNKKYINYFRYTAYMSEITTLRVKKITRDRLENFGYKSDSFDDILNKLMDNAKELKR